MVVASLKSKLSGVLVHTGRVGTSTCQYLRSAVCNADICKSIFVVTALFHWKFSIMEAVLEEIRRRILELCQSHEEVATVMQESYPDKKGLSSRMVRRLCKRKWITRCDNLTEEELDAAVMEQVSQVSH